MHVPLGLRSTGDAFSSLIVLGSLDESATAVSVHSAVVLPQFFVA